MRLRLLRGLRRGDTPWIMGARGVEPLPVIHVGPSALRMLFSATSASVDSHHQGHGCHRPAAVAEPCRSSLFTIEDVFDIAGRGCSVVPGIPYSHGLDLRAGAQLTIVTPIGENVQTHIASFEHLHCWGEGNTHAAFTVGREVGKAQLPVGSDVYLSFPG